MLHYMSFNIKTSHFPRALARTWRNAKQKVQAKNLSSFVGEENDCVKASAGGVQLMDTKQKFVIY